MFEIKTGKDVGSALVEWYSSHARTLPWRQPCPNPYHVWISEIMLQQTRVEAVKEYYSRFLNRLPTVRELARVEDDVLMKLWQGLGYYSRASNLKKAAGIIMEQYEGRFPEEYEELLKLPGIGEYTAGAIASMAFGKRIPAVDGNVYRIYTRLFGDSSDITRAQVKRRIREDIQSIMPQKDPGAFNQAWMDLGAGICIPNGEPLCEQCPLKTWCVAGQKGNYMEFPVKPEKKPRKRQNRTILLLEYQGKYMLQKRPKKGLLAGLWEFPAQEEFLSPEELSHLLTEWDSAAGEVELLGTGKHIFSHVEWHMLGYLVHLKEIPKGLEQEECIWATVQEMESSYSIPSAFQCYYEKIK